MTRRLKSKKIADLRCLKRKLVKEGSFESAVKVRAKELRLLKKPKRYLSRGSVFQINYEALANVSFDIDAMMLNTGWQITTTESIKK